MNLICSLKAKPSIRSPSAKPNEKSQGVMLFRQRGISAKKNLTKKIKQTKRLKMSKNPFLSPSPTTQVESYSRIVSLLRKKNAANSNNLKMTHLFISFC